jgi:YD repeat-containing protein
MRRIIPFLLFVCALRADLVRYAYDDAGRLAKVDYPSGASIVYTYDPAGNLLSRAVNVPPQNNVHQVEKQHPAARSRRHGKQHLLPGHA